MTKRAYVWHMTSRLWERAFDRIGDGPVNSIKKAHQDFLDKRSKGKKGTMKKILCFIMLLTSSVQAQITEPESKLFNFGNFFDSVRVGYAIDQHGDKSSVFYTSILTYHTESNIDLVSFNIGYEGVLKRPTTMIGIRLDNIIPLTVNGNWGKKHITTAKLPTFEFGPFVSFWPKDSSDLWILTVRYGLGAAIGF